MTAFTNEAHARASRERKSTPAQDAFYARQAALVAMWTYEGKPPQGLILGEVPQVSLPHKASYLELGF